MFNPYNQVYNPVSRIDDQIKELQNLKKGYQSMLQQPTQNIFNVGNTPQIQFEARYTDGSVNPNEVIVQHETAFIDLKNGLLSIKNVKGDIKEYPIVLPKTPEQLKIEELERKLKDYEQQLSATNEHGKPNEENEQLSKSNDAGTTKNSKRN